MPLYAYKATDPHGKIVKGKRAAANENELTSALRATQLEVIDLRETVAARRRPGSGHVSAAQLAAFFAAVADLMDAGLRMHDALRHCAAATQNVRLQSALAHTLQAVENGQSLAEAFAANAPFMPSLGIAVLEAGEQSGDLRAAFASLAAYYDKRATVHDKLKSALRYPLFLLLVAGCAVGFLLVSLIPNIVQFLQSLHGTLPLSTRALIAASDAVRLTAPYLSGGAVLAVAAAFAAYKTSPTATIRLDALILSVPFIGTIIRKGAVARFCAGLALLLKGGCALGKSLAIARDATGNSFLAAELEKATAQVVAGADMSAAFRGILPDFACNLLQTGERGGDVTKSLWQIADICAREAQSRLNHFIAMLEPSLTAFVGLVLAWTVLAVLGPLYGSLSLLGGRM